MANDATASISRPSIFGVWTPYPMDDWCKLFTNVVKIGGIEHPLPSTSIDMARYDDDIAVLMRGTPTQIWTLNDTFVFNDTTHLLNRIHPFALALT